MGIRRSIFIAISILMIALFMIFCTPAFSASRDMAAIKDGPGYILKTGNDLKPGHGHYMILTIRTENPGNHNHPFGTGTISWSGGNAPSEDSGRQRFKIFIDELSHKYYIPLGQNRDWYGNDIINSISLEIPAFEEIKIDIIESSLKERIFFPVDSYLASLIDYPVIPAYSEINRFIIPSYIFLVILLFLAGFYFLFMGKERIKYERQKRLLKKAIFISILFILLLFSAAGIYSEIISAKSHITAYGDDLLSGKIEDTYLGIYDFERFIAWADETIPEGRDIIVFIKGEPVYIMSEFAYNMYPRDIKFVDISGKTFNEVKSILEEISDNSGNRYKYLIILSEDNTNLASRLELIARYRSTGGYIYRLR